MRTLNSDRNLYTPASMTGWLMLNILVNGVENIGCEDGMAGNGEGLGPWLRPRTTYMLLLTFRS